MRQVEALKKLAGGRYLVTLDCGMSFPLYRKELDIYHIEEGGLLAESDYEAIMSELLPKRAKLCAMHQLEKRDKTEYQLRQKMAELFYPKQMIDEAITYVKHYHYVDDLRYAVSYISYRREQKSIRQLEQELYQKGISKELIQEAFEQIDAPDEEQQIRNWLQKKHYDPAAADHKETNRIYGFLLRKGYPSAAVQKVMRTSDLYE